VKKCLELRLLIPVVDVCFDKDLGSWEFSSLASNFNPVVEVDLEMAATNHKILLELLT